MNNTYQYWLLLFISLTVVFTLKGQRQYLLDSIKIIESRPYADDLLKADLNSSDSFELDTPEFLKGLKSGQVQINSPGGLVTLLNRGMSNRQLNVQWNGANIQSIVNGSFDLSLIPTSLFNNMSFYTVGSPALNGNNSMAGTFQISNSEDRIPLKVCASLSSMYNINTSVLSHFKTGRFEHNIGIDYIYDKNKFKYFNGLEIKERSSTDFQNMNLLYRGKYYLTHNQSLAFDTWFQQSDRRIPVSITSAETVQKQHDKNLRLNLKHIFLFKTISLYTSALYMVEKS
ncbi:MAG: Plug domain-containing protein [Saprospiraceae bacterium]|nr:Plug domain-containing protein [Saprospiraceae bacterium]